VERVYFEIDENNIEQWEKPQIRESKKAFFYATITGQGCCVGLRRCALP
jgi:ryanodine receptor 2